MTTQPTMLDLHRRLRRNRTSPAIRALVQETRLHPHDLIQSLFLKEGKSGKEAIESLPGQSRLSVTEAIKVAGEMHEAGIQSIALFPQIEASLKDDRGSYALNSKNWFFGALRAIKAAHPALLLIADVALDPFTSHGHDGLVDERTGEVMNDSTVEILAQYAGRLAEAGTDFVAPSDMMDGRVGAIRYALDMAGHTHTGIIAYAAKYASCYYGPFREAVGSLKAAGTPHLDKKTYQLNPANAREALLEARLDEDEGADIVMVKPAGLYLDIIRELRVRTDLPVAAYQVSGEYAQIHAAAERGWLDLERAREESLMAIKRAGASMIFTYFAAEMAKALKA